jgi:hypothetical protein
MKKYTINIDRKVSVWVNEEIEFDFDGTEAEVKELIQKHGGNIHAIEEFKDLNYNGSEYLVETEHHMDPESENLGFETHEIHDLEVTSE